MKYAMEIARNKVNTPEFKAEIIRIAQNTISVAKREFDRNPPESFKRISRITILLIVLSFAILLFMFIGGVLSYISVKRSRDQIKILERAIEDKERRRY